MADVMIEISSPGGFAAKVKTFGAELSSLTNSEGTELLWDGDPVVWAGQAPILFPIVGRLRDQRYGYDGRHYQLPKHGFARAMEWANTACKSDSAVFELRTTDDTRLVYPFEFLLKIAFLAEAHQFTVRAKLRNEGQCAMPASFGFHPAFRWPILGAPSRNDHVVVFKRNEDPAVYRIGQSGLLRSSNEQPVKGRFMSLSDELFQRDALILDNLKSRSLAYGARGHRKLRLEFKGLPHLGFWSKPHANFVCLEPWHGFDDIEGFDGDIFSKPGIFVVEPGKTWTCEMTLSVQA